MLDTELDVDRQHDPPLPGPEIPGVEMDRLGWQRIHTGDSSIFERARVEFFFGMGVDDEETLAWLWPERVPLGMVTLLEGNVTRGSR